MIAIARRIVERVSARKIRQSSAEPSHCAKDRDSRERELERLRERVAELELRGFVGIRMEVAEAALHRPSRAWLTAFGDAFTSLPDGFQGPSFGHTSPFPTSHIDGLLAADLKHHLGVIGIRVTR